MASGSYAYATAQRLPLKTGRTSQTRSSTMSVRPWNGEMLGPWLRPWVLCVVGAICFLAILISTGVLNPHPASSSYVTTSGGQSYSIQVGGNPTSSSTTNRESSNPKNTVTPSTASQTLVRINQTDEAEYANQAEHDEWQGSTCSTASMTEVLDSYGDHYRITDVLRVESGIGAISASQGLLYGNGIDDTARQFGFVTTTLSQPTIGQVVDTANQGSPVIVNFHGAPDWTPGHFLVVIGGTSTTVKVADSSIVNGGQGMQNITYAYFQSYWHGYAKVLKPSGH